MSNRMLTKSSKHTLCFSKRTHHEMKNRNETRFTKIITDINYLLNLMIDFTVLRCKGGNL